MIIPTAELRGDHEQAHRLQQAGTYLVNLNNHVIHMTAVLLTGDRKVSALFMTKHEHVVALAPPGRSQSIRPCHGQNRVDIMSTKRSTWHDML